MVKVIWQVKTALLRIMHLLILSTGLPACRAPVLRSFDIAGS